MSEVSSKIQTEHGLLMRIRSWRDALPWLAVVDCLRPITSILVLCLIALGTAASLALEQFFALAEPAANGVSNSTEVSKILLLGFDPQAKTITLGPAMFGSLRLICGPALKLLFGSAAAGGLKPLLTNCLHQFLLLCIWVIPAGFVMRQSGLAMAGRPLLGTTETLRLIASRFLGYLGVVLIPTIILVTTHAYFLLVTLAYQSPVGGPILGGILDVVGIPVAIIGGLLGFGAIIAVPLGWAAVSLERDGSSFDGISRGYEYTLRRPIQWLLYGFIGLVVLCLLVLLSIGVSHVAIAIVSTTDALASPRSIPGRISISVISYVPTVVQLTIFWSLLAWLYLLLRRSANNQEIEDVWEQTLAAAAPLPELDLGKPSH